MASNSYYHLDAHSPPPPAVTTEMFSIQPTQHRYSNLPSQPAEDSANPQFSPPIKEQGRFNRLKQRRLEKLKRYTRILDTLSQLVSSLSTLAMFGIMVYVLIKFESTKDTIRGGRGPWAKETKLWPAILLFTGSAFTLIVSVFMLCAYCCCFKITQRSWKFTLAKYALHIVLWAVISFLYRYEKGLNGKNNDLWGWACSAQATALQPAFDAVVDFKGLCDIQVCNWKHYMFHN